MKKLLLALPNGQALVINICKPYSLAIVQTFTDLQPNFFHASFATKIPMQQGNFKGAISCGSSCNAFEIQLNPHCNGTHTECAAHITNTEFSLADIKMPALLLAQLITLSPEKAIKTTETYACGKNSNDLLLTQTQLQQKLQLNSQLNIQALIIRTLPNPMSKCYWHYNDEITVPYLTSEAMHWITTLKISHLLLDTPSLDRVYDSHMLPNHHTFFNTTGVINKNTITELAFISNDLSDGYYALQLNFPALLLDAAPSNPVLYEVEYHE